MTELAPPWRTGDTDVADELFDALEPLDGFAKGSRLGPRPYGFDAWWVVVTVDDRGRRLVGPWGPADLRAT